MKKMAQLDLGPYANISNSIDIMEDMEIINKGVEKHTMLITIVLYIIIAIINAAVLFILFNAEKTVVNILMMLDAIANTILSCLASLKQFPFFTGFAADTFCSAHIVLHLSLAVFNRLVPMAIALFR